MLFNQLTKGDVPYIRDMAGRPPLRPAPTFGARLAALRKQFGWTQPQLAKELGITLAALTYYERQAKNPTADFVSKVAETFGVSTDDLLGIPSKADGKPVAKPGPQSKLEQLTNRLSSLPRQKQKLVMEMLEGILQKTGS